MARLVHDSLGRVLEVGQKCVYNKSGELAVGTVEKIDNRWKKYTGSPDWFWFVGTIHIRHAHPNNEQSAFVSKVKNPKCIAVVPDWPWK